MKTIWLTLPFLLLISFLSLAQSSLSNKEKKMMQVIEDNNPQAIKLLENVVNINSGSMHLEGVKEVGMVFKKEFDQIGFETEWVDGKSFNRAGHLVASFKGSKSSKTILMIGHLDTVFPKDSEFQKFEKLDENFAIGPGIIDMKGGNIVILQVLKALISSKKIEQFTFHVILTGDEEKSGDPLSLARAKLIELAKASDYALGFENGDGLSSTANVSRRGSSGWQLKVKGRPAHSSQIFSEPVGDGAIYETARILEAFRKELRKFDRLTFNAGTILGGTTVNYDKGSTKGDAFGKTNVVPQTCIVNGDIRAMSPQQFEEAVAKMKSIVSKNNLLHTEAALEVRVGYPPLALTEGNQSLLSKFSNASETLGYGKVVAVNPLKAGAADISFCAGYVKGAIDGLGLSGTGDHTIHETGDLRSLMLQTKRVALMLSRF